MSHHARLESIRSPADLRRLPASALPGVAAELREYLIQSVSRHGGHFAAGLGTVELTVALHYVFDTPHDRVVWDVGHQCYPHKVLTGRRERMPSIRRRGGLSGFLARGESEFDAFGAGHSSTSISAALGMALASGLQGAARKVVAVIGDGGMTAGLAYEALNHAGAMEVDLLVVLNDNEMSISPNVGALCKYLTRILSSRTYARLRSNGKKVLSKFPPMWDLAHRTEREIKRIAAPGMLFEELGFNYLGPIDGHDLPNLVKTLRAVRQLAGPRLLHVVTRKGKGYSKAEADPVKYHGVTPFDPGAGIAAPAKAARTYTQVFGDWLCETAAAEPRMVAITPAMREGSGLVKFAQLYPQRYYDVGIAEQHSVTLAAGLACEGLKPVVAIYSTFLQRAYDQLIHDVALQKLPVLFAIDRAGPVGPDGPTHNGSYDLTVLRCIPAMVVMTPTDEAEMRRMLDAGLALGGPAAVRYPRATAAAGSAEVAPLELGRAHLRRCGKRVAFLVFGPLLAAVLQIADALDAAVLNMRFVKPLDEAAVLRAAEEYDLLVTVEENVVAGGAGSAVNECLLARGCSAAVLNLGLPDRPLEHATREEMLQDAGLDAAGIRHAVERRLHALRPQRPVRGTGAQVMALRAASAGDPPIR